MLILGKIKIDSKKKVVLDNLMAGPMLLTICSRLYIIYVINPLRIYIFSEKFANLFKDGRPIEIAIDNYIISDFGYFSTEIIEEKIFYLADDLEKYIDFTSEEDIFLISRLETQTGILMLSSFESQYLLSFDIQFKDEPGLISLISSYFSKKNGNIICSYIHGREKNHLTSSIFLDIGSQKLLNPTEIENDLRKKSNKKIVSVKLVHVVKSTFKKENKLQKYGKIFISYSSKDKEFVEILLEKFIDKNIEFWFDEKDIKIGDKIQNEISNGLHSCDKFLLICSKHSLKSWWVDRELDEALQYESRSIGNKLIPINLDDQIFDEKLKFEKKIFLLTRHIGDFTDWESTTKFNKSFEKLLAACEI